MPAPPGTSAEVLLGDLVTRCRENTARLAARLEAITERVARVTADADAAMRSANTLIIDSKLLVEQARRRIRQTRK